MTGRCGARRRDRSACGWPNWNSLGILEEERALLGEKQREPRQVDLLFVGFDLREIGVHRQVERQLRAHAPFDVEADVAVRVGLYRCRASCRRCTRARQRGINFRSRRAGKLSPLSLPATDTRCSV